MMHSAGRQRRAARGAALSAGLVIAVAVCVAGSLLLGSRTLEPSEVGTALVGGGSAEISNIVWGLRVPRTLLALAAGASLAVAGALAQSWTRNPLADPGFIGVTAGASCAVALSSLLGAGTALGRGAASLVGAAAASALVVAVSTQARSPLTLVLVGVGVDTALRSAAGLIGLFDTDVLDVMRRWTTGSTFGRDRSDIVIAVVGLALGLALAGLASRPLDLLAMGEETSRALGSSPRTAQALAAAGVVVLAGSATAAVGPVAFVGFAAPHLVRRVLGPQLTRMVVPTALLGAVIVLAADIIGRLVMRPGELEMSIVVAVIGTPALIAAVNRGLGWRKAVV
ncbi:FecCD family ABC transporter permease [Corynebacterium liangguodongii]|uniref:Uncharacterized protein n=1 Tax=Corynebacterium liangguodongii TaxID=2079535 RepID=A0A2S0WC91_9CORY|nr:iron ABC transporter permease [Corynebacterium liangguodongii]AWB83383.1 hypothetical protein C3E79_01835 [Corynebacterium liangguodongii]PWC00527.1 iron ABC transporter permease [Corynebacterium liangguodongii]